MLLQKPRIPPLQTVCPLSDYWLDLKTLMSLTLLMTSYGKLSFTLITFFIFVNTYFYPFAFLSMPVSSTRLKFHTGSILFLLLMIVYLAPTKENTGAQ